MQVKCFGSAGRKIPLFALPIMACLFGEAVAAESLSQKAQVAQDIGASERVNYSGKLRMLSQRIVATSCNFAAGVDSECSGEAMRSTKEEFSLIVDALEYGNPDLGIFGEEKRSKSITRINQLRELWDPFQIRLAQIVPGEASHSAVEELAEDSGPLLEAAKLLVVDLSAQYSDSYSLMQSHALVIDISGRQRMLIQRIFVSFHQAYSSKK